MQNEATILIEKLINYFNVMNLQELANKLNIKQSSLSSWKSRNSISAIKKKCREMGIYDDIFGDLDNQQIGRSFMEIMAERFNVKNGEEVMDILDNFNSNMEKRQNEWMLDVFGDEIIELLRTAATVTKDEKKKESFKNNIKKWILENL